jgi:hypothetical protein
MRDLLAIRAEAFHEFTYPRPIVDMPPETEDTAFNRAARVYEAEIKKLQAELAAAQQRVTDADSFLNHWGSQ